MRTVGPYEADAVKQDWEVRGQVKVVALFHLLQVLPERLEEYANLPGLLPGTLDALQHPTEGWVVAAQAPLEQEFHFLHLRLAQLWMRKKRKKE